MEYSAVFHAESICNSWKMVSQMGKVCWDLLCLL